MLINSTTSQLKENPNEDASKSANNLIKLHSMKHPYSLSEDEFKSLDPSVSLSILQGRIFEHLPQLFPVDIIMAYFDKDANSLPKSYNPTRNTYKQLANSEKDYSRILDYTIVVHNPFFPRNGWRLVGLGPGIHLIAPKDLKHQHLWIHQSMFYRCTKQKYLTPIKKKGEFIILHATSFFKRCFTEYQLGINPDQAAEIMVNHCSDAHYTIIRDPRRNIAN